MQTQSWSVDGTPAGTWVSSRNLTYVKVSPFCTFILYFRKPGLTRAQIFNASHMAGYDVPHVTHDMILRFMGVNFTALTDGSVRIPSAVGADSKPVPAILDDAPSATPVSGNTPEQDKAMWEGASRPLLLSRLSCTDDERLADCTQRTTTPAPPRSSSSS